VLLDRADWHIVKGLTDQPPPVATYAVELDR